MKSVHATKTSHYATFLVTALQAASGISAPASLRVALTTNLASEADANKRLGQQQSRPEIRWEVREQGRSRSAKSGTISSSVADEELARWNVGGNGTADYVSSRPGYHPGTRVIVDVTDTRAHGKKENSTERHYLAEFRNHGYWPYRLCFETALNETQSVGVDSILKVSVGRSGRVTYARMLKTTAKQPKLALCLVQATRSISVRLAKASVPSLTLRVRVHPGDAPLMPFGDGANSIAALTLSMASNQLEVQSGVETCIREGVTKDSRLWGRLLVRLQLDAHGNVLRAVESYSHFPDRAVVECTLNAAKELMFPNVRHPSSMTFALRVGHMPEAPSTSQSNLWVDSDSNRGPTD